MPATMMKLLIYHSLFLRWLIYNFLDFSTSYCILVPFTLENIFSLANVLGAKEQCELTSDRFERNVAKLMLHEHTIILIMGCVSEKGDFKV
jgi:hypothetical protein